MANVNIYDKNTGLTKTLTIDVSSAVIQGSDVGSSSVYITVSTSAKDPLGGNIPTVVLEDDDFVDDLTDVIQTAIVEVLKHAAGEYLSSSSSSESSSTQEMTTSSQSSQSSSTQGMTTSSVSSQTP